MKERIMLMFGVLFVAWWLFVTASNNRPQQYNYNGGLLKNVYAAIAPDNNSKYVSNPEWEKNVDKVTVRVGSENVQWVTYSSVYIPPPPRDSH